MKSEALMMAGICRLCVLDKDLCLSLIQVCVDYWCLEEGEEDEAQDENEVL